MDDLHTLALQVARRVLESESEDADIRELARSLLEEARLSAGRRSPEQPPPRPALQAQVSTHGPAFE